MSKSPEICIHSFTDHRSLTDPEHYRHIYFRGLGPALEKADIPFFYLIDVLPTASYLSAVHRLLHYPENCHLLEEFITFSDLARAHRFVAGPGKWWNPEIAMCGVLMGHILDGEQERDGTNTRREEAYLRYFAGKRIASGSRIGTFVSIFENHVWETMFRRAFRSFSPRTRLVGYAHSIVNTMYTCYSVSAYERDLLPLPDVIAVNGIRAKNVLEQSGFAGATIAITGALRYQHLEKKKFSPKGHKEKIVLVALSAGLNDSLELTQRVIAALGDREGFSVSLKCHPTLPFSIISRHLRTLPGNVHIRGDPIEKLLADADVLLYAESTVCVEALALGVPPVNVKSALRIDMNIFEGINALPSVSTPEEIREAIREVTSDEALERFNDLQGIVEEFFAPVNEDFLEIFTGMKNRG
jgi:glycosyltransferase involved in cell wall biosynthesis